MVQMLCMHSQIVRHGRDAPHLEHLECGLLPLPADPRRKDAFGCVATGSGSAGPWTG